MRSHKENQRARELCTKFVGKAPTVTAMETNSTKVTTSSASIAVLLSRASSPIIVTAVSTTSRLMKAWKKEGRRR